MVGLPSFMGGTTAVAEGLNTIGKEHDCKDNDDDRILIQRLSLWLE